MPNFLTTSTFVKCSFSARIGGTTAKGGGALWSLSDTFSTSKASKNGNFWKFLGKIGLSDTSLAPEEPTILRNFSILVKNHPIL